MPKTDGSVKWVGLPPYGTWAYVGLWKHVDVCTGTLLDCGEGSGGAVL